MGNEEHLARLKQGVEVWNEWREADRNIRPDLREANLDGAALHKADLRGAIFTRANLTNADLREANLFRAGLVRSDLRGAIFTRADLRETDLYEANLTGAHLFRAALHKADLRGAILSRARSFQRFIGRSTGLTLFKTDFTGATIGKT